MLNTGIVKAALLAAVILRKSRLVRTGFFIFVLYRQDRNVFPETTLLFQTS